MQVSASWEEDVRFKGKTASGFEVMIDGEQKQGARPLELMLLSIAGCSSYDVIGILKKARQEVVNCVADVVAERADAVPAVFTKIHIKFTVTGHNLKEKHVQRAVHLSANEYCSASIMLKAGGVEVTHSFEIIQAN